MLQCELDGLTIRLAGRTAPLIDHVDLRVERGEKVAIVGETGAGKSMIARAIAGVIPEGAQVGGVVRLGGRDVTAGLGRWTPDAAALRSDVAMVFQDPRSHLDPRQRIGDFLLEGLRGREARLAATARVLATLERVRIADPERCMRALPHQLSGGTLQRIMIASALADAPAMIVADEPTTALDMTSQAQVCALLGESVEASGAALVLVTHDLDLAAELCDRAVVMREGRIVDEVRFGSTPVESLAPYTRDLLAARPGDESEAVPISTHETLLAVSGLRRSYRHRRSGSTVVAVADSSFEIRAGACLALVGESGSGKSTTARMIVGLERPDSGTIVVGGEDITVPPRGSRARRRRARAVQLVHQDPYLSLDPRQTARRAIDEAQRLHFDGTAAERDARLRELTDAVGLTSEMLDRLPRDLSGGQRQRVAIARALVTDPQVLVLDEAVSALDVSVQAQVLALLRRLRLERGMTFLFVTHDLNVVRALAEEVIVMRAGEIVERGETGRVLSAPQHEYTRRLIDAIPLRYEPVPAG